MPVSLCEWRVRIGRFVHSVREYVIRERKEKLLMERIRRLKLLHKRLLEKKDKSEDKCESNQNEPSVKVDDVPIKSSIINNDKATDCHKEDSCSGSESTIEENTSQTESTTNHKSKGDDSQFPFFFTLLLVLFCLLLSLIFFFVVDLSNLLESSKPLLNLGGESTWRSSYLIMIVCSILACIVCIINSNTDVQDNLVLSGDENAKDECIIEANKTPTESINKEYNTATGTTIKSNISPTESNIEENNTQNESDIGKNCILTDSRIKEKINTATESTKECNNIPMIATSTKSNTPSPARDGPLESEQSETKTSKRKSNKEKNTTTELIIQENMTLPESTIKDNIAPNECHINTPSTMIDKPSNKKTSKEKKMATESTYISNNTITDTSVKENNSPTESIIKDNNTPNGSTMNDNNTKTKSTIKDSNTPSTTKDKSSKRKIPKRKPTKYKNTATKSKIKGNTTTNKSTIKGNTTSSESTMKGSNSTRESTIKDNTTTTESTIKEYKCTSESTMKDYNSTNKSAIKGSKTPTKFAIKDDNSPTESTVKKNNSTAKSTIKDTKPPVEPAIKDYNARFELSIKDNSSTIQCTIKEKNTPTVSPIKGNNSTSESAIKDSNTTHKSEIKEHNTSSRTPTEENNNQPLKENIAQAEVTIRSGIQKVLSDGKHGISSQIPSSLKGTTNDPVMQESTCLPEMLLVKAGDVEQNPGPFDRTTQIQEQELLNLVKDVPSSKYTDLCNALGVSYNQSQTILDGHLLNFTRSLNAVFFEWKDRQRDGTDCRQVIAAALRGVNLDALGDKMSRGDYLSPESAQTGDYLSLESAQTASIANEKKPLTTEQVTRCGDDFKTFYRTQLFKIKTDPLNFSLIFEFERIYTDLVLLRNEQGTTKKTPLDYKELLKTKVNGELPKRLIVEGEGGAGKTTFCSKMAWDWTNGADGFQEFVWVLVIPLRDIERNQTIGDIARTYLSDSNSVQPHQIDEYILANPSKVFIILDGLDEYDGDLVKQGNDIAKIIRSEKFQECRVLVTTRPWKVDQIKSNEKFMNIYAFIAVAGFDERHISIYINKYFADDSQKGRDLVKLIENNDVIQENMAPFPIYIAMLCILWRDSDSEKRELIRRLKTFSQLFQEIIISLKDHYVSKQVRDLDTETVKQYEQLDFCFSQIGEIALSGIMKKKLVYGKDDFSSCEEAMETCCRVGVLSHETRLVRRQDRHTKSPNIVRASVFFPHKLFQEYFAGMYLASLLESDHERYETAIGDVIPRAEEFRYLLYFTASQSKNVAIDVTNRLDNISDTTFEEMYEVLQIIREHYVHNYFLVDIVFEAFNEDVAKMVGQQLFAEQKSVIINEKMSAHTVSGYLFIMEKIKMETLILTERSCGPTVSRDLADVICSSTALTALELRGAKFHDDFYGILESKVNTSKVERLSMKLMKIDEHTSCNLAGFLNNLPMLKDLTLKDNCFDGRFYTELASGACSVRVGETGHLVRKLHLNHRCNNDILQHGLTVKMLFPNLEHLYFTTLQTVSPNIVGSFAHSGLTELSFSMEHRLGKTKEDEECHVPLVGDPSSLEQVFLNSFPLLTNLSFNNLVIGNNRCKIILSSLKQHQHLEKVCVIHCYTDEEIDPIVSAINLENRMKVKIQHNKAQRSLKCMNMSPRLADALCHRTSIQELILMNETTFPNAWFSEENHRTIDSKIEKVFIDGCYLRGNDPTASRDLAQFLCLLPRLTDLTIKDSHSESRYIYFHDDFYHELACLALSSKIENVCIEGFALQRNDPTASRDLAKFLCLLPRLTDLTIKNSDSELRSIYLHDDFYHELACLASSSKIEKVCIEGFDLQRNDPKASRDLAKFLCRLPRLTDLTKKDSDSEFQHTYFHDDFYHEIAGLALSSKIEKVCITGCLLLGHDPKSSRDLAKFLCLLPRLTDLTIKDSADQYGRPSLHNNFFHEIARLALSSKIEKVCIAGCFLLGNDLESLRDLAKFLCLLPRLTDLTIKDSADRYGRPSLHDNFYHELARLASSSEIKTVNLDFSSPSGWTVIKPSQSASKQLAQFLCSLPSLTNLVIDMYEHLHDDFFTELDSLAASSQNPYFREMKHTRMLENYWSARNRDMPSTSGRSRCSGCSGCSGRCGCSGCSVS